MTNAVIRWSDPPDARVRLVCWPHAGAGTARFRQWSQTLGDDVAVWAACLPGRERRIREEPHRDIAAAVAEALVELEGVPVDSLALFGHCSGALIALAVARQLALGGISPRHLFVAGQAGPRALRDAAAVADLDRMPDAAALVEAQFGGRLIPPTMLAMLTRAVEADFDLAASFDVGVDQPLPVPITALLGDGDEHSRDDVATWRHETSTAFAFESLPGDHLLEAAWDLIPRRIAAGLRIAVD